MQYHWILLVRIILCSEIIKKKSWLKNFFNCSCEPYCSLWHSLWMFLSFMVITASLVLLGIIIASMQKLFGSLESAETGVLLNHFCLYQPHHSYMHSLWWAGLSQSHSLLNGASLKPALDNCLNVVGFCHPYKTFQPSRYGKNCNNAS